LEPLFRFLTLQLVSYRVEMAEVAAPRCCDVITATMFWLLRTLFTYSLKGRQRARPSLKQTSRQLIVAAAAAAASLRRNRQLHV
jgi:hypothetical protein